MAGFVFVLPVYPARPSFLRPALTSWVGSAVRRCHPQVGAGFGQWASRPRFPTFRVKTQEKKEKEKESPRKHGAGRVAQRSKRGRGVEGALQLYHPDR